MSQRDYYDILGLNRDADAKAIKNAFHHLAMKYHPDRNKTPDAEAKFKDIAKAYAVLSDPDKRAQYDARGPEGVPDMSAEDIFSGIDFGEIFGGATGMNFGNGLFDRIFGHRSRGPVPGRDLRVRLVLALSRIEAGGEEILSYPRTLSCPRCAGTGAEPGSAPRRCETCAGSGRRVIAHEQTQDKGSVRYQQIQVCPDCQGRGTIIDHPCTQCQARGRIEREETLKIHIPPGVEEETALRVPAHGLPGEAGDTPPGDLFVVVYSAADPRFERRGADLWADVNVGIAEAVLGTQLTVDTLTSAVQVRIPPGTQPGEVLRLRGRGLPRFRANGRGDLKLRVHLRVPKDLTPEARSLYERLRALDQAQAKNPAGNQSRA